MDYFNYDTHIRPGAGRLLISEPSLPDENFERSVILLCAHDDEGSFGFIMNKPSDTLVETVFEGYPLPDQPAFVGGPVGLDTLHFVHRFQGLEGAQELLPGIFWGGDADEIRELALMGKCGEDHVRFLLGYSGWGPGQLEEELREKSWIVSDKFDVELMFSTAAEHMWTAALKHLGGRFTRYLNYPADPRLN